MKFSTYGLNKFKNLLNIQDSTLLNGSSIFASDDVHEVLEYFKNMLKNNDINWCAVFVVDKNDTYYIVAKMFEDEASDEEAWNSGLLFGSRPNNKIQVYALNKDNLAPDEDFSLEEFFAFFDADVCLESYGLIIEVADGLWKIVEE